MDLKDGFISPDGQVFGTYCHGIMDNDILRRSVINALRVKKGLEPLPVQFRVKPYKESQYDRLADEVRRHFDMKRVYEILDEKL